MFMSGEEYPEIILCPLCLTYEEDIEVDDYVGRNMLFWCHKHGETMICPFIVRPESNIDMSCSQLLTHDEVVEYYKLNNCIPPEFNTDDYKVYKVGILHLTDICGACDLYRQFPKCKDPEELAISSIKFNKINAYNFSEINENIDTNHDGAYLFYKGDCSECGRHHENCIWGD
jgi:hypothetical protein